MVTLTAEEILKDKGEESLAVSPDTTVYDAVKLIIQKGANAVLVEKEGTYIGIWTERDLLKDTLQEGFDPRTAKVGDYMSYPFITARHTDTVFQLIDKFLGNKVRHLVIEKDGEYMGVLYARDVIRAGLTERTKEFKELNEMVSWDYYEDWKWERKHQ